MWGAYTDTYKLRTKIDDPVPATTITQMLKFIIYLLLQSYLIVMIMPYSLYSHTHYCVGVSSKMMVNKLV